MKNKIKRYAKLYKKKIGNNSILLSSLIIILICGIYSLIKEPIFYSYFENRVLNEKPRIYIKDYLSGKFQNDIEKSLSDQFIGSQIIKINYRKYTNLLEILRTDKLICENKYISDNGEVYRFNCSNQLIKKPYDNEIMISTLNDEKDMYNYINKKYDVYYYFIEDSSVYDFEKDKRIFDFELEANKIFEGNYHIGKLTIDNIDLMKKYFYNSDHHWNEEGAREGYKGIINLIYPDEELYEPIGKYVAKNYKFYGSNAKQTRNLNSYDKFWAYKYDLPEYTTIINRKNMEYGYSNEINNKKDYEFIKYDNPYAIYYGADYGEILFDYHNDNKENILILSSSFSNPLNKLVAAHFNKTYIVDIRHYKKDLGIDFNIDQYMEENNIQKILVLGNAAYYKSKEFEFEVGEQDAI